MDSLEDNTTTTEKDFESFSPGVYLEEYYSEIQNEDRHYLRCLANAYANVTGDLTLLELGGGPTLYQLISAAVKVREIHFSDYMESNLSEVRKWVSRGSDAFNWNKITATALQAEGSVPATVTINAREEMLREKITKFFRCNAFQKYPLVGVGDAVVQYDIVNTHFVAEPITGSRDEWKLAFANICRCVKPGGKLVMAAMKQCTGWKNGPRQFPATYITEPDIVELLTENGFRKDETVMETFPASQEEYSEVIFFSSNKSL